jgi:hypothetical protein
MGEAARCKRGSEGREFELSCRDPGRTRTVTSAAQCTLPRALGETVILWDMIGAVFLLLDLFHLNRV